MITWPEMLPTINLGDLVLRPFRESDAQEIYEICQDPVIQHYTTVPVPYELSSAESFLARQGKGLANKTDFALAGEVDGKLVTGVTVKPAFLSQHLEELNPKWRVLEAVEQVAARVEIGKGKELSASSLL